MTRENYLREILGSPSIDSLIAEKRAFDAALAYEKNCRMKYDHPLFPSRNPIKGERISDFAEKFQTTVNEMKLQWKAVEFTLDKA